MAMTEKERQEAREFLRTQLRPSVGGESPRMRRLRAVAEKSKASQQSVIQSRTDEQGIESVTPGNIVRGIGKGVASTLTGVSSLGEKVIKGIGRVLTPKPLEETFGFKQEDQTSAERLVPEEMRAPQNLGEKIGFYTEQIGEFFVPATKVASVANAASKAMQAGKKSSFVIRTLAEAASDAAVAAGQTGGELRETAEAGLTGAAFPAAAGILKGLGFIGKTAAKFVSSKLTDVPEAAIEFAFKNPSTVRRTMRQFATDPDVNVTKVADDVLDAFETVKDIQRKSYRTALEQITKRSVPELSTEGVKQTAKEALESFGVRFSDDAVSFKRTPLPNTLKSELREVYGKIVNWDDATPLGLDDLREIVGSYYKTADNAGNRKFNAIITRIKNELSNYVTDNVPEIGEMNRVYGAYASFLDDAKSTLSIGSKNPGTLMRKLNNVFNPRSQFYQPVLEELGERAGVDIMSDVAGLTFSKWTAEGLGGKLTGIFGGPAIAGAGLTAGLPAAVAAAGGVVAASSPRLLGEVTTLLGSLDRSALGKIIKQLPRMTKATILEILQHDLESGDQENQ